MRAMHAAAMAVALLAAGSARGEEPKRIRVLATTTDLAALAREVGGDAVQVDCLTAGPEDAHFLDARPSFVRKAHEADLFVKVGMGLELGYEVPIVRDARNPRIQPGTAGYCDASSVIDRLEVPTGTLDRSMGDVHPEGNPHFLTDPVRAKAVAGAIADSLARVDPARTDRWKAGADAFARRVDEAMFGTDLLEAAPVRRLERLLARGELGAWLKEKGLEGKAGGWARTMLPLAGTKVVAYHGHFTYLLDRFGIGTAAYLEPKPGVPPTPGHLRTVVETMKAGKVLTVLRTVFNPATVAETVARETGGRVEVLAHMPGATEGTEDYLSFVGANVERLAKSVRPAR